MSSSNKGKIITQLAILGRIQIFGAVLVKTHSPSGECLVRQSFYGKITDPIRDFTVDTSDCTIFTVTHLEKEIQDIPPSLAGELFEQALQAISEVVIWQKACDQIGKGTSFNRQIGILDVKFFFVETPDKKLIGWKNPLYDFAIESAALISGFIGKFIVEHSPSVKPIPVVVRRMMSSMDLVNLGFYTESFVNLYALLDDLVQEVIKSGLEKKGLNKSQQKELLMAIKESRLKHYLTSLAKICDWESLEVEDKPLFDKLMKVNKLRNNIMHGSARLSRTETIDSSNTILNTIYWLQKNPFGYVIQTPTQLNLADNPFFVIDPKYTGEDATNVLKKFDEEHKNDNPALNFILASLSEALKKK